MNTLQTIICLLALIATGLSVYILARTVRKQSEGFRRRRRQDEDMAPEEDVAPEDEEDLEAEEDEVQNVEGPSWDKTTKCMSDNASYFIGILVVICIIGVVIHYMMKPSQPSFPQGMMGQLQGMPQPSFSQGMMQPMIPQAMPQLPSYGYRM